MPRLLDLFCGAGGAAVGYARAGFEVVGVDIKPQPRYPFEFIQANALEFLGDILQPYRQQQVLGWSIKDVAAIHASPPCQAYVSLSTKDGRHPELIEPTRELLIAAGRPGPGIPYVIENVVGAPLENPVQLCGSIFGLNVRRHRLFETNFPILVPGCQHGTQSEIRAYYGKKGWLAWSPKGAQVQKQGRKPLLRGTVDQAAEDMGIDWMTWDELREAIPPAYTEYIGHRLREVIEMGEAA